MSATVGAWQSRQRGPREAAGDMWPFDTTTLTAAFSGSCQLTSESAVEPQREIRS